MRRVTASILFLILFASFIVPRSEAGTVQLPQTGQISCWDTDGNPLPSCAGTGQDGNLRAGSPWPAPRFAVAGDCVTDNLTGLVWARDGNLAGAQTWYGALDWVAAMNSGAGLCGYHDWRLPNRKELLSLVNAEEPNTADWLNKSGFTNVQADWYWSSSTFAYYTGFAWVVYMCYGNVDLGYNSSNYYYVWPVRAGQ